MLATQEIVEDPDDVRVRLARDFGLPVETFHAALGRGLMAWATCTANDPPSFPGQTFWAVTTRSIREEAIPLGWEKCDARGYSRILNRERGRAIVVATGDRDTGNRLGNPRTKWPKGQLTVDAVEVNRSQLELFEPVVPKTAPVESPGDLLLTHVLLVRQTHDDIYAELSLPLIIGDDDRIEKWSQRIILPPFSSGDGFGGRRPLPEPGPEIEVSVVRRTG